MKQSSSIRTVYSGEDSDGLVMLKEYWLMESETVRYLQDAIEREGEEDHYHARSKSLVSNCCILTSRHHHVQLLATDIGPITRTKKLVWMIVL